LTAPFFEFISAKTTKPSLNAFRKSPIVGSLQRIPYLEYAIVAIEDVGIKETQLKTGAQVISTEILQGVCQAVCSSSIKRKAIGKKNQPKSLRSLFSKSGH